MKIGYPKKKVVFQPQFRRFHIIFTDCTAHDGDYRDDDGSDSVTPATLRWQELPRACLPQLMPRGRMMDQRNKPSNYSNRWQFTLGLINAVQWSIWKVTISSEDDIDSLHLPQIFSANRGLRFACRRDPNYSHVYMSYHLIKVKYVFGTSLTSMSKVDFDKVCIKPTSGGSWCDIFHLLGYEGRIFEATYAHTYLPSRNHGNRQ